MADNNGRHLPFPLTQDMDEDVDMYNFFGSAIQDHSLSSLPMTEEYQFDQFQHLLQTQTQPKQQLELQQQEQHIPQPFVDAYLPSDVFSARSTNSKSKGGKGKAGKGVPNEAANDEASAPTIAPTPADTASSASATPIDLRKEQNRAAQRAFRDRKERYLHQLENMIQDLKEQHFLVTNGFQKKVLELTNKNEGLMSENHYLREVVFAFEAALSENTAATPLSRAEAGAAMDSEGDQKKGCGCGYGKTVLQNVKEVLYLRHHAIKASAQEVHENSPELDTKSTTTPDVVMSESAKSTSSAEKREMEDSKESEHVAKIPRKGSMSSVCSGNTSSNPEEGQEKRTKGQELQTLSAVNLDANMAACTRTNEILYKVPPLFIAPAHEAGGKPTLISSPFDPLIIPRPSFAEPGGVLPKITDYLKHPTVFDELQSSLFPPGTLQSLVDSNMATPQEVIEDRSLFDSQQSGASRQQQQRNQEEVQSAFNRNNDRESQNKSGGKNGNSGKGSFLPNGHRLKKEFDIISSITHANDPKIDPMIYTIPHDPRIDIIPCAQLRAQMILHQDKYDMNEVINIVTSKAICHGSPMDPHSWELPEVIYIKFGYLFGKNGERHRRKIWPRKLDLSSPSSDSGSA